MLVVQILVVLCLVGVGTNAEQVEAKPKSKLIPTKSQSYVGRFHPGQDIMQTLTDTLAQHPHKAVTISSATGSVLHCHIRFANQSYLSRVGGPLQITSITGTFDRNLNPHLHIAVADGAGNAFGGHLPSLKQRQTKQKGPTSYDCPLYTTLEISLHIHENVIFQRKLDPETTYDQLSIFSVPRYYPLFRKGLGVGVDGEEVVEV